MTGFVTDYAYTLGWQSNMKGWSIVPGTTANDIMGCYAPDTLPVLSALARGYAVCDQWFASVPTETMPNRAFACSATSQGHMDDKTRTFTSPSIFGLLSQHQIGWAIYGYNAPPLTKSNFPDIQSAPASNFGEFAAFQAAAAAGTLPAFAFLEPSWNSAGNSQHPNYNVALGEQLIHDVYQAVRNGPGWAQTLLVITYDEHGGCYDHVPPPAGATPPDNTAGEFSFDFTRFGVRVPTVLISPLIAPGIVYRAPDGGTPLDHTSVLKLIEWRWGLAPLTQRDASSSPHDPANLAHALDFASPDPKIPNLPVLAPFVLTACTASPASPTRATLTAKRGAPSAAADGALAESETWVGLRQSQLLEGWA